MRYGTLLTVLASALAVKDWMFRKCDQNPFCKRNRLYADHARTPDFSSPYAIDVASLDYRDPSRIAGVLTSNEDAFPFILEVTTDNVVHLLVDEQNRDAKINPESPKCLNRERFDPAPYMLDPSLAHLRKPSKTPKFELGKDEFKLVFSDQNEVVVSLAPFEMKVYRNGELQVAVNKHQAMNIEPLQSRAIHNDDEDFPVPSWLEKNDVKAMWTDTFDEHTDTKVRGPESVALDTTFEGYSHVYGVPEHADRFSLKDTLDSEPYRLYNVDIFEYETESPLPMYGSIPFMLAHKAGGSAGVFWLNAADTYIDIMKQPGSSVTSHWMSETGKLDVYVLVGDHPKDVIAEYGKLTGYQMLPQLFSIGYHQCRWNYNSQADVLDVNAQFDKHDIPYDVIWLDIDYTVQRKYFTWLKSLFPNPDEMMDELNKEGRKLVAIIDPHIKVESGYEIYETIRDKSIAILDEEGKNPFEGHCWPGNSVWIDTLNPDSQKYWTRFFGMGGELGGYAKNLFIWNDMNEPSVFSGTETSAPKNLVHYGGWQHRDVHNYYGQTLVNATYEAMLERYSHQQRPFILTRSFFAGSQKLAAMWTGDNQAEWAYLQAATPMILTMGAAGMPFAGADVGGFFRDPSPELISRWYQAGVFYPFFRGHAHIDSKRREPYLIPAPYNQTIANALELRYQLLPTIYTAFWKASQTLAPIMRPLFWEDPDNESLFAIDDQFMFGDSLMAKPVVNEGVSSVSLALPNQGSAWYDYYTGKRFAGGEVPVDVDSIPLFVKGGEVVFRRDRPRRSAELTRKDPYTLIIAFDAAGQNASGEVYVDDGVSFDYVKKQDYLLANVSVEGLTIRNDVLHATKSKFADVKIERIILYGAPKITKASTDGRELDVFSEGHGLIIRNPAVAVGSTWQIDLS